MVLCLFIMCVFCFSICQYWATMWLCGTLANLYLLSVSVLSFTYNLSLLTNKRTHIKLTTAKHSVELSCSEVRLSAAIIATCQLVQQLKTSRSGVGLLPSLRVLSAWQTLSCWTCRWVREDDDKCAANYSIDVAAPAGRCSLEFWGFFKIRVATVWELGGGLV